MLDQSSLNRPIIVYVTSTPVGLFHFASTNHIKIVALCCVLVYFYILSNTPILLSSQHVH